MCAETRLSFPGAVEQLSCDEIATQLGVELQKFYERIQNYQSCHYALRS